MKDADIQKLIDMNYRSLTLLGYATAMIDSYDKMLDLPEDSKEKKQYRWFMEAINDVIYLGKPILSSP